MGIITRLLFDNADAEYADFAAKLAPGISRDAVIGVRLPIIREIAKKADEESVRAFLSELPHKYYDENIMHSVLLTRIKRYDECVAETEKFLPYIDNWAVCDIISPSAFKKNKADLLCRIKKWISSEETYTCRFGVKVLMNYYLDGDFKEEYLGYPATIVRDDYYVNMMIAWFYATALAKQYESILPYLEKKLLPRWVHNKTIQKAVESFRVTDEQKSYLKTLRIK